MIVGLTTKPLHDLGRYKLFDHGKNTNKVFDWSLAISTDF